MGRKRGTEPLTRERILEAALLLVDEEGLEALSMRRLASSLGVDPMAIYHHIDGKHALLAALVEVVFDEMEIGVAVTEGPWQERVRDWARSYHSIVEAHPNFVLHIVANAAMSAAAAVTVSEPLYQALLSAGLSAPQVVDGADVVVDYVNGFSLAKVSEALAGRTRASLIQRLSVQAPDEVPAMRTVFAQMTEEEIRVDLERGLDVIMLALEALAREATPRQTAAIRSGG